MNSNKLNRMKLDKEEFNRLQSDTGDWVLHFKKEEDLNILLNFKESENLSPFHLIMNKQELLDLKTLLNKLT